MTSPAICCEHTELRSPAALKVHPRNPNKHPRHQVEVLRANIEQYGWRHPVVISERSGYIVAGHCRRAAAQKAGWSKVPVDVQSFSSEEEEIAVLLSDNIIPELASMDDELLAANKELLEAADMDLEILGFTESPSIAVVEGEGQRESEHYSDVRADSYYTLNMFGLGGYIPRELGDAVKMMLLDRGAEQNKDNRDVLTDWLTEALEATR